MSELSFLSAADLAERYRSKRLSPVELVKATLANIDELNPLLNAFRVVDHEAAMAAAKESEKRWLKGEPLSQADGVPFGVKDLLLARGHTTRFGSRARLPDQDTTVDAPAVAGYEKAAPCFSVRQPLRNLAGRARVTARSPASRAIHGTPLSRLAAAVAVPPLRRRGHGCLSNRNRWRGFGAHPG